MHLQTEIQLFSSAQLKNFHQEHWTHTQTHNINNSTLHAYKTRQTADNFCTESKPPNIHHRLIPRTDWQLRGYVHVGRHIRRGRALV